MPKPNFIFIVSDSLRADSLSYAGHPDVHTPVLDEASEQAHVFLNHHAQAPVCGPSRNSFWTGRYPHSNGSLKNLAGFGAHQLTFAEALAQADYDCVSFGANHLQPEPAGFRQLVSSRSTHPESSYRKYLADLRLGMDPATIDPAVDTESSPPFGMLSGDMEYHPDAYSTTRAIEYLEGDDVSPFFLYLGLKLPHPPYVADQKHYEIYDPAKITIPDYQNPEIELHPKLQKMFDSSGYGALSEEQVREVVTFYLAMVTFVDAQVGRVLSKLKETGLDGRTHVVFTSDHADFCGEMGMFYKADLPIRSLTHVPLLWMTPDRKAARSEVVTENVDLAPTFLDYAGVDRPYTLEGKNLFEPGRGWALAESSDGMFNEKTGRYDKSVCYSSYVDREWHYIHSTDPDHCALYDLLNDPHCHRNVLNAQMKKADELRTKLLDHMLSGTVAHQDNSLASWGEFHGGIGADVRAWA